MTAIKLLWRHLLDVIVTIVKRAQHLDYHNSTLQTLVEILWQALSAACVVSDFSLKRYNTSSKIKVTDTDTNSSSRAVS